MDELESLLKCSNCRLTLSEPILLACGHIICRSHTEVAEHTVICWKCGLTHSRTSFVFSESVANLISHLSKLDLGAQHKETCKSCDELKKQLDKSERILNDPGYFIHESIDVLRNKVLLKSEKLKFQIDEITQELLEQLDEYEQSCKDRVKLKRIENGGFPMLFDELKLESSKAKVSLIEWSNELNSWKVDESRWRTIQVQCEQRLSESKQKLEELENSLLSNAFGYFSERVEFFQQANIDSAFKATNLNVNNIFTTRLRINPIDSIIVDNNLSSQLMTLCQFDMDREDFQLLYRGSRDGYRAKDFHSKCDNRPSTITIVQTTNGYIFGAYTQASWCSSYKDKWAIDARAFLFSLVNPFSKPFVCKTIDSSHAICCDILFGPSFGRGIEQTCDFRIWENSNTTFKSYINGKCIQSYEKPAGLNDICHSENWFCDSNFFQVREIEVFRVVKNE